MYHFDNKTAIVIPSYILQYTGDENMTLSTWIWMQKKDEQQFILAATDPQRLDRKHFGLYTKGMDFIYTYRAQEFLCSCILHCGRI